MKYNINKTSYNPTNTFQVEVGFLHKDAITIYCGIVCTNATPVLEFFLACKALTHTRYWDVPGYYALGESNEKDSEGHRLYEGQYDIPPGSPDCEGHAAVSTVTMFWYNNEGAKFGVAYET